MNIYTLFRMVINKTDMRFLPFLMLFILLSFSCAKNKEVKTDNNEIKAVEEFFNEYDEFSNMPYLSTINVLSILDDEDKSACNVFNQGDLCIVETDTILKTLFNFSDDGKVYTGKGILTKNEFRLKCNTSNDRVNKYRLCKIEYKQKGVLGGCIIYATELYSFSKNDIVKTPDDVKKNISREMMSVNFCVDAKGNIRLSTISELPKFFKKYPTARFATESELEEIYNKNKVFFYNLAFYLVPIDSLNGFINQNPDAIELKRNQISWKQ